MSVSGTIHLNGKFNGSKDLRNMSGYVMQDDLIHFYLTVYETLIYTARLRMYRLTSEEKKEKRVHDVLDLMGISYCRDVIIGDARHKGISGMQR